MNTPKSMVTEISGNPNSDRRLHYWLFHDSFASKRFYDGEVSHLDLNEELVVEKAATSGTTEENTLNSNADPQASFQATTGTAEDNTLNSEYASASFQATIGTAETELTEQLKLN
ncbi:hypothetical protein L2E82_11910 [Cichorium intybus]|uniref:Uncharacterized protein n=1 Tax=Cichorium intybus TaxID=13427 RepID=A0ACB9GEI3_CICIN|nr:hypothetical protein L2E82_11910 [Cichorium intybus]